MDQNTIKILNLPSLYAAQLRDWKVQISISVSVKLVMGPESFYQNHITCLDICAEILYWTNFHY